MQKHANKMVADCCSATSLLAPSSNLTMIDSDVLIVRMRGTAHESFALCLLDLSYRMKSRGGRGRKLNVGPGCTT